MFPSRSDRGAASPGRFAATLSLSGSRPVPHAMRRLRNAILLLAGAIMMTAAVPAWAQRPPGVEILPDSTRESRREGSAPEAPTPPEPPRDVRITVQDDRDHTIEISVGNSGNSGIVRFGDDILIREGEFVDGDVVAMGGRITNLGRISGDCVAIGGSVRLGPGAEVQGDVVCIGSSLLIEENAEVGGDAVSVWGGLQRDPTARVRGDVVLVGGISTGMGGLPFIMGTNFMMMDVWSLIRRVVWVGVLFLLALLIWQIFPQRMRRISDTVAGSGIKCFLAGLAGWVLWLPVFLALIITIVGIPIAIMLIFLTPLLVLVGYAGVAESAGRSVSARFLDGPGGANRALLVGLLLLEAPILLGRLFGILGSVFDLFAVLLSVVGYTILFIAGTMGFGAVLMTRFRRPDLGNSHAGASLPPSPSYPPPATVPPGPPVSPSPASRPSPEPGTHPTQSPAPPAEGI